MSNSTAAKSPEVTLDLSDVDHRVGQLVGGGQLWEPCAASDIRRWVMALDYPNPIHWDYEFAQKSKFGGIVAPQSICVALDYGHGAQPACVGCIPGSHLLFGGEEWWFYGHRVRPGDKLFQERRFYDYKVTDTKFAGPTMFQRGDTVHRTQHGTLVAKERATSIRYLAAEAEKRNMFQGNDQTKKPVWTADALKNVDKIRHDWILSNREGVSPRFDQIKVGDKLPQRAIGPHSIASFTTEYRAFLFNIWGTFHWVGVPGVKDPWINQDPGWVEGFGFDEEEPRSTRASATVYMSARLEDTSMMPRVRKSAFRAPTATAPPWVHGRPIIWRTGPGTTAWCGIPSCRSGARPSRAMSRSSTARSLRNSRSLRGACRWWRSSCR